MLRQFLNCDDGKYARMTERIEQFEISYELGRDYDFKILSDNDDIEKLMENYIPDVEITNVVEQECITKLYSIEKSDLDYSQFPNCDFMKNGLVVAISYNSKIEYEFDCDTADEFLEILRLKAKEFVINELTSLATSLLNCVVKFRDKDALKEFDIICYDDEDDD